MKKNLFIACSILSFAAVLCFTSCGTPSYPSTEVTPGSDLSVTLTDYSAYSFSAANVNSDFMRGVDASEVLALEECGQKWYDSDNLQKDVFEILSNHGVNWIRLRIWNDYTQALSDDWGPYGYNNLNRTINMAQRAKKYGMKVLLDFHYSDTWADPSQQKCPAMWSSITTTSDLATAVGEYTKDILTQMKNSNCAPDMVQIGNEMQGDLFQTGNSNISHSYDNTLLYLKAAAQQVKTVLPECKIMLHMSNGGKYAYGTTMLNYASDIGTYTASDSTTKNYISYIGVSYYTWYASHGTDEALKVNLKRFADAGYNAVIVENSFAYSNDAYTDTTNNTYYQSSTPTGETKCCGAQTAANLTGYTYGSGIVNSQIDSSIDNQAGVIKYLMELCNGINTNGGYFYWGGCYLGIAPDMPSAWENQALFDKDGKVLPSLDVMKLN